MIATNYYALLICILSERYFTPSKAFHYMTEGRFPIDRTETFIDNKHMAKLHRRLSYPQIGRVYKLPWTTVYTRIRRIEGRIKREERA